MLHHKPYYFFLAIVMLFFSTETHSQAPFQNKDKTRTQSRGIPAYPGLIAYQQSDGSTLDIFLTGDAVLNRAETTDGYTLLRNMDGTAHYAMLNEEGDLVCSGITSHNPAYRTTEEKAFVETLEKHLSYSSKQKFKKAQQHLLFSDKSSKEPGVMPSTGNPQIPVLLVNFSDASNTFSASQMSQPFTQSGYNGVGCIQEYFQECSDNQLNLQFSFTGWQSLPQTHDYYGIDSNWGQCAYDAIALMDPYINYSQYDNDGDGIVEAVSIIHQGSGEEASWDTTDIWSHMWTLAEAGYTEAQRTFDGVEINTYTMQPEDDAMGNLNEIGIMCHEIGHLIGAPDFYDTDNTAPDYRGTGFWDLMADGLWNGNPYGRSPAHPNLFAKIHYYGWLNPVELTSPLTVSFLPTPWENQAYYVTTSTANEYFLLENKLQSGFDSGLPGQGMLIYHVDQDYIDNHFSNNDINASSHLGLKIMDAGNNGSIDDDDCPFPGSSVNTVFTDASSPSSLSWSGNPTNKPITNISTVNVVCIAFDFMGGSGCVPPPAQCKNLSATSITDTSISLQWTRGAMCDQNLLVLAKASNPITSPPVAGMPYTASSVFGVGNGPDAETHAVFFGDDTTLTVSELSPGTEYHFSLHEAFASTYCYRLPGLTGSFTTTGTTSAYQDCSTKITLFPVASSDKIRVNYPSELNSVTYRITDSRGSTIEKGFLSTSLSISHLRPGLYILQVRIQGKLIRKKFIRL